MSYDPTTTSKGAWRILVLDRTDRTDPKWIVATVVELADVRPATPADTTPGELTAAWVRGRASLTHITLTPLAHAAVWRVDEES